MDVPRALYVPTDAGFEATALTIGPWDPGLQHAGPPAALLAREAECAGGSQSGQAVRLAYDILGPVPVGPVRVHASVIRPGRRRASRRPRPSSPRTSPTTGRWIGGSRPPRGGWLGMDATTVLGDLGAGQCFAVLLNADGPMGRSAQSLFVEHR